MKMRSSKKSKKSWTMIAIALVLMCIYLNTSMTLVSTITGGLLTGSRVVDNNPSSRTGETTLGRISDDVQAESNTPMDGYDDTESSEDISSNDSTKSRAMSNTEEIPTQLQTHEVMDTNDRVSDDVQSESNTPMDGYDDTESSEDIRSNDSTKSRARSNTEEIPTQLQTHEVMDTNDRESTQNINKFAICAWVKNEAPYLSEWIEHHASIGFNAFILYNDHSSDDTQCVLDAYADKGVVKRIPEDMNEDIIDDSININHQGVVYELCRKYLHNLEQQSAGSEKWWMFTTDPDEFLWINRSPGTRDTVNEVLQRLQSTRPDTLSIKIPTLTYGSSKKENYSRENVMKSFHHRFDAEKYWKNPNRDSGLTRQKNVLIKPYQVQPKAMSLVSAMNSECKDQREYCFTPHCHSISNETDQCNTRDERVFYERDQVQEYFAIAHYKVKSREEFYNRVCFSQYLDKYYLPPKKEKGGYPGCCSPKSYFDSLNNYTSLFDDRMDPFEKELASSITDTASHCETVLSQSICPKHLMEITGEVGMVAMQRWKDSLVLWDNASGSHSSKLGDTPKVIDIVPKNVQHHPLVFSAGFGRTDTRSMFKATCKIGLCSLHWALECCNRTMFSYPDWYTEYGGAQQAIPYAAWLAHEKVVRAFRVIRDCLFQDDYECPSINLTFDSIQHHIDNVISMDIDVLHDSPYTEFAEHVLKSAEKLRGIKPIVLLSEGDPETWAKSQMVQKRSSIILCKPDLTREDGSAPISSNIYLCLKAAIAKGLGESSLSEIFISPSKNRTDAFTEEEMTNHLREGLRSYQEKMRDVAMYNVNLLEQDLNLEREELGKQILQAFQQQQSFATETNVFPYGKNAHPRTKHDFITVPSKRACMPDAETAMVTGRHCDKLIVFLHFHKSGGTSMIDYLHRRELRSDFRINSDPARFDYFNDGDDMHVAPWKNNLRLHSHINGNDVPTRASNTEFWWSLYDRGLDFVNLEYNFLLPKDYFHVKSVFWTITMIRKPWDRFRSTFEKELSMRCETMSEACYERYNMADWLDNHTGILSEQRIGNWGGILHSNYYVRMLNGLGDQPDLKLSESHLDIAKRVLDTFDYVLTLEEPDASKEAKLLSFLGDDATANWRNQTIDFRQQSNNVLKKDPLYQTVRNKLNEYQAVFEEQNVLDIKLYEYVRSMNAKISE